MTNQKFLMFAVAGLMAPLAYEGPANAEVKTSTTSIMVPHPLNDTAPVTGTPPRLRRTDQEQPGNEMTSFALFGDGVHGLYFSMTTELNGTRAPNQMQMSLTPFTLQQDAATGAVSAVADTASAKFVTNNNGQERRNANDTTALTVNGGNVILAQYNYNNGNTTDRYAEAFNQAGTKILNQTRIAHHDNDNSCMHQDGENATILSDAPGKTEFAIYCGANGNGTDDGWVHKYTLTCDAAATTCSIKQNWETSVEPNEERSRGAVSVGPDKSFIIATDTGGNNQPQRNGVWMTALDSASGNILWRKQIAGRIDSNPAAGGRRTYAQRAIQERVMAVNATTGKLEPTANVIFRWADAAGNNNTNNGKGGTYYTQMLAVYAPTRTGLGTPVVAPVDMATQLAGLGGTHLGSTAAVFGTTDKLQAGLVFLNGSHTGGGFAAQIRPVGLDLAAGKFVDYGMQPVGSHDRHLYSNYLGNNPGNQGRNHTAMATISNPFVGKNGNTDAYLLLSATSGKELSTMMNPAIKLTAFMTVTPIAQTPATGTGGGSNQGSGSNTGMGSGSGSGSDQTGSGSDQTGAGSDPGTTLGGCSAGGSSGIATFLLIGLAAFIRRRR